jgi:hypothetical protein
MHEKTSSCVAKGEALIAKGDADSVRYACLELRMSIEHLFYDLIPLYADELPTDMLRRWQPKQVIEAITDCDPHVQDDGRLAFMDDQSRLFMAHETKAVTKRLIKDYWHKLGSHLHASMAETNLDSASITPFLQDVADALRAYGDERVMANLGRFVTFCCECGHKIKRNAEALKVKPRVVCPDVDCGAMWDYADVDGTATFTPVRESLVCPRCNTVNFFGAQHAVDGQKITCCECDCTILLRQKLVVELVEQTE